MSTKTDMMLRDRDARIKDMVEQLQRATETLQRQQASIDELVDTRTDAYRERAEAWDRIEELERDLRKARDAILVQASQLEQAKAEIERLRGENDLIRRDRQRQRRVIEQAKDRCGSRMRCFPPAPEGTQEETALD